MATPTLLPSIFKCGYQCKYSESVCSVLSVQPQWKEVRGQNLVSLQCEENSHGIADGKLNWKSTEWAHSLVSVFKRRRSFNGCLIDALHCFQEILLLLIINI